jgi:hypothetical protein
MPSNLEFRFDNLWNELHPDIELETEVKLIPKRRFRFDYVHLLSKIIIEVNGGNWAGGRHTRPANLVNEYEKLNLIQSMGYNVFILTGEMITERWLNLIAQSIKLKT